MPLSPLPSLLVHRITDLTPQLLTDRGIKLLMLDFDNTIVPYTTDMPTPEVEQWLKTMCQSDIQICVVSNSHKDRVPKFCAQRGIPCITHAKKPSPSGVKRCMEQFSITGKQAALVGDQIYTDTLAGNLAGVQSILVDAIYNHNFWLKARHVLELPFIFAARKRRWNP